MVCGIVPTLETIMVEQGKRTAVKTAQQLWKESDTRILAEQRRYLLRRYINMLGHLPLDDLPTLEFVMQHVKADLQTLGFRNQPGERKKESTVQNLDLVTYHGLCYDPRERLLTMTGRSEPVQLSTLEGIIMHKFITEGGKTVSYQVLLAEYQNGCYTKNPTVDNLRFFIFSLRRKIGDVGTKIAGKNPDNKTTVFRYIQNVECQGYRLEDPQSKQ